MQQTSTLVQASADVVRIVTLRRGDVYKRLEKDWNNKYSLWLGVTQSVDYNGESALVTAIEINPGDGKTELRTYGDGADLQIFTTTPEEVQLAINEAVRLSDVSVRMAERALATELASQRHLEQVISGIGEARVPEVVGVAASAQITP